MIGAYIPADMSADTDEPRMPETYQDLLVLYGRFYGLLGQVGMATKAQQALLEFMTRLAEFVVSIKARFPGGRDYEPEAPEFKQLRITDRDKRLARQDESRQPA